MDTIFTLGDEESNQQINIDDLYERKKTHDLNTLSVYNKILGRIHNKIKLTSRQHLNIQYCWYVVPEMMLGIPQYNLESCIAYCINKLNENGFMIRYTHPNLFLISWQHWVPSYVRSEIKKKTGIVMDGYGNKIEKDTIVNKQNVITEKKNTNKEYRDINTYKPLGIYNKDMFNSIEYKSK